MRENRNVARSDRVATRLCIFCRREANRSAKHPVCGGAGRQRVGGSARQGDPPTRSILAAAGRTPSRGRGAGRRCVVPNSHDGTVTVIDPQLSCGPHVCDRALPQQRRSAHDLTTLWVANNRGNSLTPIDPVTGREGRAYRRRSLQPVLHADGGRHRRGRAARGSIFGTRRRWCWCSRSRWSARVWTTWNSRGRAVRHRDVRVLGAAREARSREPHGHRYLTLDPGIGQAACRRTSVIAGRSGVLRRRYEGERRVPGGPEGFRASDSLRPGKGRTGIYPSRDGRFMYVTNAAGTRPRGTSRTGSISVLDRGRDASWRRGGSRRAVPTWGT